EEADQALAVGIARADDADPEVAEAALGRGRSRAARVPRSTGSTTRSDHRSRPPRSCPSHAGAFPTTVSSAHRGDAAAVADHVRIGRDPRRRLVEKVESTARIDPANPRPEIGVAAYGIDRDVALRRAEFATEHRRPEDVGVE